MHRTLTILILHLAMWTGILWNCPGQSCSAQGRPAAEVLDAASPGPLNHGLPEILSQQLFRDRQIELLLRSAGTVRDARDAERLRESLLPIFAHPHDLFEFDSGDESASSLRRQAMTLLTQSSPELQRMWVDSNRIIADQELESAIRHGGRHGVAQVARRYPLTESGIRATVIQLTCELLKGDAGKVSVHIQQLETTYAGTVLQSELQRQLRSLKKALTVLRSHELNSDSVQLSISSSASRGSIAPPWPRPLWTWREKIWNFPGTPQRATGELLSGFDFDAANRFDLFNNWQPAFWKHDVVIRTPFRIIALDRSNGQERWSVPTDTFRPQRDTTYEEFDELSDPMDRAVQTPQITIDQAFPIHGMAEFGLIATDRDFLFFVDRFEFLSDKDPYADNRTGRVIRQKNGFPVIVEEVPDLSRESVASRLVAVYRGNDTGLPVVAWQIGDGDAFPYKPVTKVAPQNSQAEPAKSTAIETAEQPVVPGDTPAATVQPWFGHRFLSPPTGQGTRLFVLTLNETQVFLNCLQRNTGELLWRQPLAYTDENAVSFVDTSIFTKRTSVCIVSGDMVVCSMADGMLIGVSAVDGTLMWATAIRDAASIAPQFRFGRSFLRDEDSIPSPSILVPCISDEVVVCCNHHSDSVYGVSLQSGDILWKTSRRAFGAGEVGGSPDYYVAGICQDQVILIGDRHCRSLDLHTGDQNWVVEIHGTSGRAECRGDRCIVPMRSGQAVTVNLATGAIIPPSIVESPKNSMDQYGAVSSDDELICVSTPTGVAVFPRVDTLLEKADQIPALTADSTKQIMIRAQAHLINGDFDSALALLRDAVTSRVPLKSNVSQLDEFLAKLILEQWGEAIESAREAGRKSATEYPTLSADRIPQDAAILSQLKLPPDLEFRAAVFQLLSKSSPEHLGSLSLEELQQRQDWHLPLRLTNRWSVRPDLVVKIPLPDQSLTSRSFEDYSIQELRQTAGHFLQHPEIMPDESVRQQFASHLTDRGEFAVAELFLIRWCEASQQVSSKSSGAASEMLNQMRSGSASPAPRFSGNGLTSAVSEPLTFEVLPFIRQPDADFEALSRQLSADSLPKRIAMHTYLTGETTLSGDAMTSTKLLTIDPADGTVRDEVSLPFSILRTAGKFVPLSDGNLTPSLFPVCGADEIAMISCPLPGQASVLWRRRFRNGEKDAQRVQFGSLGSDHLVWQFGDKLHCSNPLTGDDLWTRQLTLSQSEDLTLHRGRNPSLRRIAGDRQTTVVTGSDSRSYERFQTRDGGRMDIGRLNIGHSESVVAVGRCLLYTDEIGRLHLFDSTSGINELEKTAPILPLYRDHKLVCQVLEDNRVLLVSATPEQVELVMIDVEYGKVIFRTPVSEYVSQNFDLSFSAFERNRRLFAGLSGAGRSARSVQQAFMRGSPHLSNGPLLCLNPVTGEVQWSVNVDQAIFPDIHGDPTDLLVSWTAPRLNIDGNIGAGSEDRLIVQVFDGTTGQLIAQSPTFSSLPPLRCVHIADERLMQLTTPNATISIRGAAVETIDFSK